MEHQEEPKCQLSTLDICFGDFDLKPEKIRISGGKIEKQWIPTMSHNYKTYRIYSYSSL